MSDEAVIRIIAQDGGGGAPGVGGGGGTGGGSSGSGSAPRSARGPFDPVEEAQKRLEADRRRAAVDLEYSKLVPPPIPFDPADEAQKRLDADKKRAEIDAEYAKLKPTPPFDPMEEARKRREGERRKAQIDAAYKDKYGDPNSETELDKILDVAGRLRGTIGGLAGPIVGAVLDVVTGLRKAQVEAAKLKREKNPLDEANALDALPADIDVLDVLPADDPAEVLPVSNEAARLYGAKEEFVGPRPDTAEVQPLSNEAARMYAAKAPAPVPAGQAAAGAKGAEAAGGAAKAAGAAGEAGAAAGGAGGMAGAAAAAGPIAAAVVAFVVVVNALKDAVKGVVSVVGSVLSGIASADSDPSVPIGRLGDAASAAGDKMLYVSPIIGLMGIAAGESAKALAGLMQELDRTADRYGEFSPQIAQAQAVAEIQHTLGDLRRAQEVGPELARYVQQQGELQEKFEDIKIKLLVRILPAVTRILEVIEMAIPSGEGIEHAIAALLGPLQLIPGAVQSFEETMRQASTPEPTDPTEVLFSPLMQPPIAGDLNR